MKIFLSIIVCIFSLNFSGVVFADSILDIPFKGTDVGLTEAFEDDGSDTQISNQGVKQINDTLMTVIRFFRMILGAIATVWIVWQGYRMLSSGGDETQYGNAQNAIVWGIMALVFSFLAEPFVRTVLYGGEGGLAPGEAILNPEVSIGFGREELIGLMEWIKSMVAIIAVFMIIMTGVQAMLNLDSDEETTKQRTNIRWIVIGIIIIIMNEILVRGLYGDPHLEDNKPVTIQDSALIISEFSGLIVFILSFFAVAAIAAIVYGGYLILTAQFDEEQADKGKNVIKDVALGIIMILISYALVSTVITLQT